MFDHPLTALQGFDLALVDAVSKAVTIPVIASSGAGAPAHFTEVGYRYGFSPPPKPTLPPLPESYPLTFNNPCHLSFGFFIAVGQLWCWEYNIGGG